MRKLFITSLVVLLPAAGCRSTRTWQDLSSSGNRANTELAARVESGFLRAAWNVYLAGHTNEPKHLMDYRRKAVRQILGLQREHWSNGRAYFLFKEESSRTPGAARVFAEAMGVADVMEEDFVKAFGKHTHLRSYTSWRPLTIGTDAPKTQP